MHGNEIRCNNTEVEGRGGLKFKVSRLKLGEKVAVVSAVYRFQRYLPKTPLQ